VKTETHAKAQSREGTQKTKLTECEIGDFVRVGDDPFDAPLKNYRHIQVPPLRPHRTISDELAHGMDVEKVELPPLLLFELAPFYFGEVRAYVWRRIS
jgi:hypothetical protein